jgi:hypothetical protein
VASRTKERVRVSHEADALVRKAMAQNGIPLDRDFLLEDGNYDLWALHYFPDYFWSMVENRPMFEPMNYVLFDTLENENRAVIQCPAGHGKSTTIKVWICYAFAREPQVSLLFADKSEPAALRASRGIMNELTTNKELIHDFGSFKSDNWAAASFTIAQRPESCPWPSFAAFGAGSKGTLGSRANVVIADDIVVEEMAHSETERESLHEWWWQAAATAPYPLKVSKRERYLNKLMLIGTSFHLADLLQEVAQNPTFKHLLLKAVDAQGDTLSKRFCYRDPEELRTLAQENAQDAKLLDMVEKGKVINLRQVQMNDSRAFALRYMNSPTDPSLQIFQLPWIEGGKDGLGTYPGCLDKLRSLGEPRQEGWVYFTGVDPNAGHKTRSTVNFACVTLGYNPQDKNRRVHLVDMDYGDFPMVSDNPQRRTQMDIILDHVKRYGGRVIIENNAQQAVWAQVLRKEAGAKNPPVPVLISGHYTGAGKKYGLQDGVAAMAPMVENGELSIPYRRPEDKRIVTQLIDEMVSYPVYATDDVLMAAWMAWLRIDKMLRQTRVAVYQHVERPAYLHRRMAEVNFPPQWSNARREAYLLGQPYEEQEEVSA